MPSKQENNNLFNSISRSHLYWGRKPTSGLSRALEGLKPGDVFLDPFCGGGSAIVTALNRGARVIASDLNPMAVFLSKVLIQPISVFALKEAFELIRDDVANNILENYIIPCPKCRKEISFDYLKWNIKDQEEIPEAVKVKCSYCGLNELTPLSRGEITRQKDLSMIRPKFWFPQNSIRTQRKNGVEFFQELFTGRNLTSLSELWHAIEKIPSARCKDALKYVFTAMLYSCSSLQMFSKDSPSSSRGWAARRFYLPPARKEKNVWQAFEARFKNMLRCKKKTNSIVPFVRRSNSIKEFENSDYTAYIYEADFLKFPFPKQLHVSHIFLDPPYIHDIDYIGFSEFWGSWLGMDFDIQTGWHPGTISIEENAENVYQLLLRIRENTTPSCVIILAYDLKNALAWKLIQETISKAGYSLQPKGPIFLDNPQRKIKKNKDKSFSTDQYFLLQRKTKRPILSPAEFSESDLTELQFFLRVTSFLLPEIDSIDTIIERASNLLSSQLQTLLFKQKKTDVDKWILDYELKRKSYNRFALILIKLILTQDNFKIVSMDASQFDDSQLNGYDEIEALPMPQGIAKGADFVAENDKGNRIFFCFHDKSKIDTLKRIATSVFYEDDDEFRNICYLVISNQKEMRNCRQVDWADKWPRGFFVEFSKLLKKAKEIDGTRFGHMAMMSPKTNFNFRTDRKIEYFKARVIKNIPVGGNGNPKHFTIRFQAPELKYVVPGQFVMVDTLPYDKRKDIDMRRPVHSLATLKSCFSHDDIIDLSPKSFLKRPFSIHRTFYRNFKWNYLKNMSLPPALASITHTV
ncbi:DNA adenine methylase, partial [bacterium]|nr:DNA adenine methylase [bacterium]